MGRTFFLLLHLLHGFGKRDQIPKQNSPISDCSNFGKLFIYGGNCTHHHLEDSII